MYIKLYIYIYIYTHIYIYIYIYIYVYININVDKHNVCSVSATEQLRGELHRTEIILIASTLLVVKAENIYRNTIKMHKTMKTELSH